MVRPKPHPLFRKIPPWEEVCTVLNSLKLSTDFPCTFTKDDICMDNSEETIAVLYGYYLPCKAKQFLDTIDPVGWTVVIKHCLSAHGYTCKRQETTRAKKKVIQYTVEKILQNLDEAVVVDFL